MNFEQGTKKLEEIIKELDSESVTLDKSITLFENGVKVTKECLDILNTSKGKITEIKAEFDKLIEVPMNEKNEL
ncbi:MAG: exodeoxyribonuclease VII small subunit [Clostridia bacterium]